MGSVAFTAADAKEFRHGPALHHGPVQGGVCGQCTRIAARIVARIGRHERRGVNMHERLAGVVAGIKSRPLATGKAAPTKPRAEYGAAEQP
jgi:hypothetical protein